MKRTFIRTKNVKRFVGLMDELQKLPPNIPKLALVFGEHGLGKSQTIQWWADKNDSVYIRANQGMTSRWLLSEIAEELGEEPYWHAQETFELIENYLRNKPKTIIVDEVDYLIEKNTVETLRDLHDRTSCPIVLVGMGMADKKLARYPHLCDRIYKSIKFESYNQNDIEEILSNLTELKFTDDAVQYLATRVNQFRQTSFSKPSIRGIISSVNSTFLRKSALPFSSLGASIIVCVGKEFVFSSFDVKKLISLTQSFSNR